MVKRPTNKKLMNAVYKADDFCKIGDRPCTINDLIRLESYFKHNQIMLIDETYKLTNKILYLNRQDKFNKYIYLFHVGDHYNVIDSMSSNFFKSYYCDICKKGFDQTEEPNCITICKACNLMNCLQDVKLNVEIARYLHKINHVLTFIKNQIVK